MRMFALTKRRELIAMSRRKALPGPVRAEKHPERHLIDMTAKPVIPIVLHIIENYEGSI